MGGSFLDIALMARAAQAAYALFSTATGALTALTQETRGDFTSSQGERFLGINVSQTGPSPQGFELRHHVGNDGTGFSATVFYDRSAGQYVLGIRGTESFPDIIEDIVRVGIQGFAGDQLVSLYRYYRRLTTPAGQPVVYSNAEVAKLLTIRTTAPTAIFAGSLVALRLTDELSRDRGLAPLQGGGETVIPPGAPVVVAGHSLGGHLALLFGRLFPAVTEHVYTYNAPGISFVGDSLLRSLGVGAPDPSRVTNVASVMGAEYISRIWSKPGASHGVYTEPGSVLHDHRIVPLADALALHDAFAKLSPALDIGTISRILSAASSRSENSLEISLDHLRRALNAGSTPTMVARVYSDLAARDDYYINLHRLLDNRVASRDYDIVPLVGRSAADLGRMAAQDVAVRYALRELMPFAVREADYVAFEDSYSRGWLASRAEMLVAMLEGNEIDRPFGLSRSEENVLFEDRAAGLRYALLGGRQRDLAMQHYLTKNSPLLEQALASFSYDRTVIFGADGAGGHDSISGLDGGDRLFGGTGDDRLEGGKGADHLEGGAGDDVLIGGDQNDVLDGRTGADRLEGGSGTDIYRFTAALDADTIVDRDGLIMVDSTVLTGGFRTDDSPFRSLDGRFSYQFSGDLAAGGTLVVNGALRVENFRNGDLGIRLAEVRLPEHMSIDGDYVLLGDIAPSTEEDPPITDWGRGWFDAYGNRLLTAVGAPGRTDGGYRGSPGSTVFQTFEGDDFVEDQYEGDDWLDLGAGDDVGFGGTDDDVLEGGTGSDLLIGGTGNDELYANRAAGVDAELSAPGAAGPAAYGDWLVGNEGDDVLVGDALSNVLSGGEGADRIFGGAGDDLIGYYPGTAFSVAYDVPTRLASGSSIHLDQFVGYLGFAFADMRTRDWTLAETRLPLQRWWSLTGPSGRALADGGSGTPGSDPDVIDAGPGNDHVSAADGDDVIDGGTGDDAIEGFLGADAIFGGDGDDWLRGDVSFALASLPEVVPPGVHDDRLDGGAGDDWLWGDLGDDQLLGGVGDDWLDAGPGNNILLGDAGDDVLMGEDGDDVFNGGPGNDHLWFGGGRDRLIWGRGHDVDRTHNVYNAGANSLAILAEDGVSPDEVEVAFLAGVGWTLGISGSTDELRFENNLSRPGDAASGPPTFPDGTPAPLPPGTPPSEPGPVVEFLSPDAEVSVEFADGTVWDARRLVAMATGADEAEVTDTGSPATVASASADEFLAGGAGSTDFFWSPGGGSDVLQDLDSDPQNVDRLIFGEGVGPSLLQVYGSGDDYLLVSGGEGVRVLGGRTTEGRIERFEFADGTVWNAAEVERIAVAAPENRPPVLPASLGAVTVRAGENFLLDIPESSAFDPDPLDHQRWFALTAERDLLPDWMNFDTASLALSGTPNAAIAGTHDVLLVVADDAGDFAVSTVQVNVEGMPPPIAASPFSEAGDAVVIDAPPSPAAPRVSEGIAHDASFVPTSDGAEVRIGTPLDPLYRDMQQRFDVLLQVGRTNLSERYAEAVREFEERRRLHDDPQPAPAPTDEEIAAWNRAMHAWHERNPGFSDLETGAEDGVWSTGWGIAPGSDGAGLDGSVAAMALPGLANPHALPRLGSAARAPGLNDGLRELR